MKRNVPKLRFKGFQDEWKVNHFSNIVERVVRKNKGNIAKRPLTISAQYGLVDQEEFFNKVVASKNLEGYYLLKNGEFAYNKSYSNGYPFGAIKRLDRYGNGAVSTLYICFKPNRNSNSDFLVQYFESSKWYKEVSMIAVEGARNHGLLNIGVVDFFDTFHTIPSLPEQTKIANFLTKVDSLIEEQDGKVTDLEKYKKSMMQKIFSQEIRFKNDNGCEYPAWEENKLGNISDIATGSNDLQDKIKNGGYPFFVRSAKIERINKYTFDGEAILIPGDGNIGRIYHYINGKFAYHQRVYKISDFIDEINGKYVYFYLNRFFLKEALKNSVKATVDSLRLPTLTGMIIKLPCLEEQTKIANFLSNIDTIIEEEKGKLEDLRAWKKGLLQQMFV